MSDPHEELRKVVASLLRYDLIVDALPLQPGSRDIRRVPNRKAHRTRITVETMRDWLSLYRISGFEALYPPTAVGPGAWPPNSPSCAASSIRSSSRPRSTPQSAPPANVAPTSRQQRAPGATFCAGSSSQEAVRTPPVRPPSTTRAAPVT